MSGGELHIKGSLNASSARVDISLSKVTISASPKDVKNQAQIINIGQESVFETSGDWIVERMRIIEGGTLQTPPTKAHILSITADSFTLDYGAHVHVSSSCAEPPNPTPIDGGDFYLSAQTLDLNGGISVNGTHGHDAIGAGNGGNVFMKAQTITSLEGSVSARGGGTWNGAAPGNGGTIEIQLVEGALPYYESLSVSGGTFSGQFDPTLRNGNVIVRRPGGLPPLNINTTPEGIKLNFSQPINETVIIQMSPVLKTQWKDLARFEAFNSGTRIRKAETIVAPDIAPTVFFRLAKETLADQ
ncbi:hypothetical protein N8642_03765 [bacterium]|nr:hypothetical protein [bacterium]